MEKRKKERRIKKILIIIFVLIVLLLILLIVEYSTLNLGFLIKKPKLFVIKDECSLILNNIIHKMKNGDECRIVCRNECELRKMSFHNSEFIEGNNSCHTCNCYCK